MTHARLSLFRNRNGLPNTSRLLPVARCFATMRAKAPQGVDRPVRSQLPREIAHLEARHPSSSQDSKHISDIHSALQRHGALKISLGFDDDSCSYLAEVVQALHRQYNHGLPITHSADRGWFWDIRPSRKPIRSIYQARSETADAFPWHTDCSYESFAPTYFALQILQPDRHNGGILSLIKVSQVIAQLSASAQSTLTRPEFRINVPPEFTKSDDKRYMIGCLLKHKRSQGTSSSIDMSQEIRYRDDIIVPLTQAARLALAELKAVISRPETAQRALQLTPEILTRGSIILLNNRTWLHARNEVKDMDRHLRRVRWDAQPFETNQKAA